MLVIFLGWNLCEVLRRLLHLFDVGVAVILESLRLLNEAFRLLNEALLAMCQVLLGYRLFRLMLGSLRTHSILLWSQRILHQHLHRRVLGGQLCVLWLWLRLSLLHWHGVLLGLPLRLLLLILLAIWGHLRAMGEGLLLVHVDLKGEEDAWEHV